MLIGYNYDSTNELFCYWLKGFFEITGTNSLTEEQVKLIRQKVKKLNEHQKVLNDVQEYNKKVTQSYFNQYGPLYK